VNDDTSREKAPASGPASLPVSGAAAPNIGGGTSSRVDELALLLREIRDRLPVAPTIVRPGLLRCLHRGVKEIEPWGILFAIIGLFLALFTFWVDYRDRVEERTVRAWQLVTTPAPGNSGKREALEYLNREDGLMCSPTLRSVAQWLNDTDTSCLVPLKGRTSLLGIALSPSDSGTPDDLSDDPPGAYLEGADFEGADLGYAGLRGADLGDATLRGAQLWDADLRGADLERADLSSILATNAEFEGANLADADLADAHAHGALFRYATLERADLSGANLEDASFQGANLTDAVLAGADLEETAWLDDTLVSGARFTDETAGPARDLTQYQIVQAWAWADDPPVGLDQLDPPLDASKIRLCDPALRDAWEYSHRYHDVSTEIRSESGYRPPKGCLDAQ
jgi:hypothetical protein